MHHQVQRLCVKISEKRQKKKNLQEQDHAVGISLNKFLPDIILS